MQPALVYGIQVDGGLLLALTARQEGDSLGGSGCEGKEREVQSKSNSKILFVTSRGNVGVAEADVTLHYEE